jgi:uncharacterized protein (TIGR02996 family)
MSDDAAFLRAIISEPADDTARLVYADFLEETGDPVQVARAEFIRTQIEAHALHPNHPRRAELERHAGGLFARHWIDWWAPVCSAIGLPPPHVPTDSIRERFGRLLGREEPPGHPYIPEGNASIRWVRPEQPGTPFTIRSATFVRGFPQWVSLLGVLGDAAMPLRRWTTAAPLTALHLFGAVARDWRHIDGEHLHGIRELRLQQASAGAVTQIGSSRHLPRLDELALYPDRTNSAWPADQYRAFAASPLAERVKRLTVVIGSPAETAALDGPHLANLTGLHLDRSTAGLEYPADVARVVEAAVGLLASPHLRGLRELRITGADVGGTPAAPTGRRQRRLNAEAADFGTGLARLLLHRRITFPALSDLSISSLAPISGMYGVVAGSPFAGQLRHLRLVGGRMNDLSTPRDSIAVQFVQRLLLGLVDALDPEKLETLVLDREVRDYSEVWAELQERFPGRVSVA